MASPARSDGAASRAAGGPDAQGEPQAGPALAAAAIDARGDAPWRIVGGLTAVARLVRSLELEGIGTIFVLSDRGAVPREALGARRATTRVRCLPLEVGAPLASALPALPPDEALLAVDGALVVDRRLLRALSRARTSTIVWPVAQRPATSPRVRLARLEPRAHECLGAPLAQAGDLPRLAPADVPTWAEEMRGPTPILLLDVSTPVAAREAERALVRDTQKQVMDWPARWIDPPVENALLRLLARTAVTPNQVTLAATALGFVAAGWLWQGRLALALPAMLLVGWLDGVDGKLARLRLHYSRLGAAEAYFDFAYENAWWVALTAHLVAAGHGSGALWAGTALVAANLLDEIAYTLAGARLGTSLDLLSRADAWFRLVAGRRNVYVWMLIAAGLAGIPFAGLAACGAWAVVTASVHAVRLATALRARRPRAEARR